MAIEEVRIPVHWSKREQALTIEQEFSIEIPDKEADAIHSGTFQWRIEVFELQHTNFCYSHPGR